MNSVTVTTANVFIPEIFSTDISDASQASCVWSDLVDRRYESQMTHGAIIHIADFSNPAVRIKSADTLATYSNVTETDQDVTVNRHAYCAGLDEDIVKIQAHVDLREKWTSKTGYSLTAFMEGDATSGMVSITDNFSQGTGTLGNDPGEDDIWRAVQYLDDGDVPEDGRYFVVSPAMHAGLLKLDVFRRQEYVGQDRAVKAITKAQVGMIANAPVYKSSLLNANPSTSGQSYSVFGHREGVALIVQRKPTVHTQYDLLNLGMGTVVDTLYQFVERLKAPSTLGGGTSDDRYTVAIASA